MLRVAVGVAIAAALAGGAASGVPMTPPVVVSALLGAVGYVATSRMALAMRATFIKAGLYGIDLNKRDTKRDASGHLVRPVQGPKVPEAMGVIAGTVYLACMFAFIPLPFLHDYDTWGTRGATPAGLSKFLCALLTICAMCFLGFADNVLDLRWRDKLWLPLTASLPLLMVYAVDGGGTVIVLPRLFAPFFGATSTATTTSVDIGALYYVFMISLSIFCTNAINILAGVNGLEVGQSVVIGVTIAINNAIQLCR